MFLKTDPGFAANLMAAVKRVARAQASLIFGQVDDLIGEVLRGVYEELLPTADTVSVLTLESLARQKAIAMRKAHFRYRTRVGGGDALEWMVAEEEDDADEPRFECAADAARHYAEVRETVRNGIDQLPPKQRKAVEDRFYRDTNLTAESRKDGNCDSAIRMNLKRGKAKLEKYFTKHGVNHVNTVRRSGAERGGRAAGDRAEQELHTPASREPAGVWAVDDPRADQGRHSDGHAVRQREGESADVAPDHWGRTTEAEGRRDPRPAGDVGARVEEVGGQLAGNRPGRPRVGVAQKEKVTITFSCKHPDRSKWHKDRIARCHWCGREGHRTDIERPVPATKAYLKLCPPCGTYARLLPRQRWESVGDITFGKADQRSLLDEYDAAVDAAADRGIVPLMAWLDRLANRTCIRRDAADALLDLDVDNPLSPDDLHTHFLGRRPVVSQLLAAVVRVSQAQVPNTGSLDTRSKLVERAKNLLIARCIKRHGGLCSRDVSRLCGLPYLPTLYLLSRGQWFGTLDGRYVLSEYGERELARAESREAVR